MTAGAAVVAPAVLTAEQLDDLATLFARELPRGNLVYLTTQVLGRGAIVDAANATDDVTFARAIVDALANAGRVGDALALLRQDDHASFLSLGIGHILAGQRLASAAQYQAFINRYQPFLASEDFMTTFPRIARTICAIGVGGAINEILGTGFLVGPDLVLTNYHVLAPLLHDDGGAIAEAASGNDVFCFFDYVSDPAPQVPPDETSPCIFTAVQAVEHDWLVAARPPLPYDGTAQCPADAKDLHDYALVRLRRGVGKLPARRSGGTPRGWLPLPDSINVATRAQRIIVHQHPGAAPLQFDIGDYDGLDPTGTRVRYVVSTAKGSSGGAAVDVEGKLFALHNAEVESDGSPERKNQGVRIDKISADLDVQVPDWDSFPQPDQQPFWSLSEDLKNPQPVIGRNELRENALAMRAADAPRVMAVWGPQGCGLRYSVKLLRRTLGASARIVEYTAANLSTFSPETFLQKLVSGIGMTGIADDPMPQQNPTENLPRWLRNDLPSWIARRLEGYAQQNPAGVPVWLVLHIAADDFFWAANLSDFVAALAGAHDPGHAAIDQPHLRFVFLASSPASVPVHNVARLEEDLTHYTTHAADFHECLARAWFTMDRTLDLGPAEPWHDLADVTVETLAPGVSPRKALSDLVRRLVLKRLARGGA